MSKNNTILVILLNLFFKKLNSVSLSNFNTRTIFNVFFYFLASNAIYSQATAVNSLDSEVALTNNNRKIHAGRSDNKMELKIQIQDSVEFKTLSCTATGTILLERYDGISGTTIADLIGAPNYPNSPTTTSLPTIFEAPTNIADDYGIRMRGVICAPETGTYYFWVAGDDNVELNLSTDDTEANKTQIAYHNSWTNSREWNKFGTQKSAAISLTAGQSYYIEALMKEGGGGDNLAVGWRKPTDGNETSPAEVIPGSYLSPPLATPPLTEGPGGVTADLQLWLKSTDGLSYSDGDAVSLWQTQARGSDATVNTPGQEPTYRDNAAYNVNFNPVVDFDSNLTLAPKPPTPPATGYPYHEDTGDFLEGASGMFTQDMFVVVIPDSPISNAGFNMDLFCGDQDISTHQEDVTGVGFGVYSARFEDEILSYCVGNTSGYGVADKSTSGTYNYNNVGIINARNNTAVTEQELYYNATSVRNTEEHLSEYKNVSNSRFWIGRSEGYEAATNARIVEILTFSSRLDATERAKVETYLAIKYGITLGINGTSQNYVDSNNTTIWDVTANIGYNYDITGIGRDDDSELNQKQSKSVNTEYDGTGESRGLLTIGLTDIYNTNNQNISTNSTTFNNREYLVWGNNNGNLDNAPNVVNVNMSAGIAGLNTWVTFTGMERVWKVIENGGDIPTVKLSIPKAAVRNISPPGSYLMFISDTAVFDPTADYRVMADDGTNLTTEYDFDGIKYITFGYAPQVEAERSVYFDGTNDYIDVEDHKDLISNQFTISSWVKRDVGSLNKSILSKRDASFTDGYDFKITASGMLEMSWKNNLGVTQTVLGSTFIPEGEWHHLAVIYNNGTASIYIDGVLDPTSTVATLTPPVDTNQSFFIGAANKTAPQDFFIGNIDEVRIWDVALSEDELHFIMNQEIEDNSNFVEGMELPTTITKNDISSIPWSNLIGYYPMSVYTFTNTNDHSDNRNQGALRNLDTVDHQTAPLPYVSSADTNWDLAGTWENGNEQYIPGSASIVDPTITVDWNIVQISSNVTLDNTSLPVVNNDTRKLLGLIVDNLNELTVNGSNPTAIDPTSGTGNGLTVTHYLELNGEIDLVGESQLIQTVSSDLVVGTDGLLEKDQQGVGSTFRYNDWSSPVYTSTVGGNHVTIGAVLKDGTVPSSPGSITFVPGVNGSTSPFTLSTYWMYKYANNPDGDYSAWEHVGSGGSIFSGEGFLMKGPGSTSDQNYIFQGKPNNGDISLTVSPNYDYLVGNPYPSVLDANKFITDNTTSITGTLYYWEHYGGDSHNLADYQAGYGAYNLSGGIAAASPHPDVNQTGSGAKTPQRYVAVSQGFFVVGSATGGNIEFNNSQRTGFFTEGNSANSIFIKSSAAKSIKTETQANADVRPKIRLGFNAPDIDHRQILLTIDENSTNGVDWGYDAKIYEILNDDMYWIIEDEKYVIQALNNLTENTVIPIGIKSKNGGEVTIKIDELENINDSVDIFLLDNLTSETYNLRNSDFKITLDPNTNLSNKYSIVFKAFQALSIVEEQLNLGVEVFMNNSEDTIVIKNNTEAEIVEVKLFNYLGQILNSWNSLQNDAINSLPVETSTGIYILEVNTNKGKISKKIIIQ